MPKPVLCTSMQHGQTATSSPGDKKSRQQNNPYCSKETLEEVMRLSPNPQKIQTGRSDHMEKMMQASAYRNHSGPLQTKSLRSCKKRAQGLCKRVVVKLTHSSRED